MYGRKAFLLCEMRLQGLERRVVVICIVEKGADDFIKWHRTPNIGQLHLFYLHFALGQRTGFVQA